jgi:hypothetical protein
MVPYLPDAGPGRRPAGSRSGLRRSSAGGVCLCEEQPGLLDMSVGGAALSPFNLLQVTGHGLRADSAERVPGRRRRAAGRSADPTPERRVPARETRDRRVGPGPCPGPLEHGMPV